MLRYFIVSLVNGIIFGILDAVINANPYAQKAFEVYKPIARTSINAPAGIIIDIIYGLAMGAIFLILYKALPGDSGVVKGLVFGLMVWFFRVLMSVISSWMMFNVPLTTLLYVAITGLIEMAIIGIIYGLFLKPIDF
jgi:hypothetical protein